MMINQSNKYYIIILILFFLSLIFIMNNKNEKYEFFTKTKLELTFNNKENRIFPFRYFTDIHNNPLPFVAVTGFFRDENAKKKYYEYINNGIHVFGITAYKSFPNRKMLDGSEGKYEREEDNFDYTKNLTLCNI